MGATLALLTTQPHCPGQLSARVGKAWLWPLTRVHMGALVGAGEGTHPAQTKGDRLGTLMLMSPMLMLRGSSGRLMFFTAETARAGAAERPPCGAAEGTGLRRH